MAETFVAMKFEPSDCETVFSLLAAILHLGNIEFEGAGENVQTECTDMKLMMLP